MNDTNLIVDTTQRIFRELGDGKRQAALWNALEEAGLTRTWVPESLDGAGATIADGFDVLRIAGSCATNVPLAETLLAGWLLSQANLSAVGTLTIAPVDFRDCVVLKGNKLSGTARAVPFAREASQIALVVMRAQQSHVALIDRKHCEVTTHDNLAGDARDTIVLREVTPQAIETTKINFDLLLLMGAAVRAIQMAGALQTILDMSVTYANERVAFEKPIGKFQAIQHSLARLAGEVAAAIAAAGSAADAINSAKEFDNDVFLEVASAKIRVGEAVTSGAAIAHQVHGAIGFSQEHALHRYTQRLWSWRDDFGSESYWAAELGKMVAANGADALWPILAAR
ncbi:MAG TPA: acyl-CoA dehydrogenase family protein [Steroidobacteraceae bacterium]|nr:acyl-CoA dehydrogenase family protein [Steroidobacteraceae bacterium]